MSDSGDEQSEATSTRFHVQICDDSKIRNSLDGTHLSRPKEKQQSTHIEKNSAPCHETRVKNNMNQPSHRSHQSGRSTPSRIYPFTHPLQYRNLRKPPKNKNITIGEVELEKKVNDARNEFKNRGRVESMLGLTPVIGSTIGTPFNEAINIEEQVMDRREEMGFRRRTFWKSCCGQVIDRRAIQFFTQVLIGSTVMTFCMAKIWQAIPLHGCTGEDTTVYFSLLSALVGYYIPSPSMHKP